jgi:hypothetical protein
MFSSKENFVAKVVPSRVCSLAIHPMESKRLVAVGDKWGSLGLWDIDDTNSESHGVHLFRVLFYFSVYLPKILSVNIFFLSHIPDMLIV